MKKFLLHLAPSEGRGYASYPRQVGLIIDVMKLQRGFTIIEILVTMAIIAILAAIVLPSLYQAKKQAYFVRSKSELRSISQAVQMFMLYENGGNYPADANRDLPPGLEKYLASGNWPKAPWPNSVYDWDNWAPTDLDYPPYDTVRQISIRFCPSGQPTQCTIPNETWAAGFDYYSAVYYCIEGPCRAHSDQPTTHPGLCVNC